MLRSLFEGTIWLVLPIALLFSACASGNRALQGKYPRDLTAAAECSAFREHTRIWVKGDLSDEEFQWAPCALDLSQSMSLRRDGYPSDDNGVGVMCPGSSQPVFLSYKDFIPGEGRRAIVDWEWRDQNGMAELDVQTRNQIGCDDHGQHCNDTSFILAQTAGLQAGNIPIAISSGLRGPNCTSRPGKQRSPPLLRVGILGEIRTR